MKTLTTIGLGLAVLGATVAFAGGTCNREGRREAMRAAVDASFTAADADGSGSLTVDEFANFQENLRAQMAAHRFERADANGDGVVTREELAAAHDHRHGGGPGR